MNEYEISVSKNGQFLFRTDWSRDYCFNLPTIMQAKFPALEGYKIALHTRNAAMTSQDISK